MVRTVALIFGIVYTLVAVLGFVPALGGTASMTPSVFLGFPINLVHNIVHLVIGGAGLFMRGSYASASQYCKIFGVVLLVVGLLGIFVSNPAGLLPLGGADVWLHLISGAILAYVGFMVKEEATA